MSQYCTLSRVQFGKLDANSEYLLLGKDAYKAFFMLALGLILTGFSTVIATIFTAKRGAGKQPF